MSSIQYKDEDAPRGAEMNLRGHNLNSGYNFRYSLSNTLLSDL